MKSGSRNRKSGLYKQIKAQAAALAGRIVLIFYQEILGPRPFLSGRQPETDSYRRRIKSAEAAEEEASTVRATISPHIRKPAENRQLLRKSGQVMKKILFFDSGMGGLSVFAAARAHNPAFCGYYLFDHACFPYGIRSAQFLTDRVSLLVQSAVQRFGADAVVVACNTASTVVLPALRSVLSVPVVGVVPAIKPAASLTRNGIIGLLATPGTVRRPYIDDLISKFASDKKVLKLGSNELVEIAESKMAGIPVDIPYLMSVLQPWLSLPADRQPDTVVLGCTHFPWIKEEIGAVFGPQVRLIDSGEAVARHMFDLLHMAESCPATVPAACHKAFYTGQLQNYAGRLQTFERYGFSSLQPFVLPESAH